MLDERLLALTHFEQGRYRQKECQWLEGGQAPVRPYQEGGLRPMQHLLQVSRKVDYALRAMIYLAALPDGTREPLQEVAQKNGIPKDFLAKIFKTLADSGLVSAVRGPHGGVAMARAANEVSFLDVIEAVEGPVVLNVCLDDSKG